jgi:anti-sigma regulatory factor (Ser/Thr protein kinase)
VSDVAGPGGDAADPAGLVVPSAPRSIRLVRRYAVDSCIALGWGDCADTVALLVSEVATNAALHAYGPQIRVRVVEHRGRLRVEVFDSSPVLPLPRRARSGAENGRGLALVEALAVRWDVDTRPDGKTFWFELGR